MTIKNRLAKLEKRQPPARNTTDIEAVRASIMAKLDAVLNGETLPAQPMTQERAELINELARRLDRIAAEVNR